LERSNAGTCLGVPAHLYRQAGLDSVHWLRECAVRPGDAFARELRLRFFAGFLRMRVRQVRQGGRLEPVTEIGRMLRSLRARASGPIRRAGVTR